MRRIVMVLVAVFVCCGRLSFAGDWTQFLGSNGNGISDVQGLPTAWSETEHVAWKVPVSGLGWSSPVVSGDRIFLTTAVPDVPDDSKSAHSLRAICLDVADGHELWNLEVFHHRPDEAVEMHGKNSHASATPVIDGDRLFVHFGTHGTACLTLDGDVVWKTQELIYSPNHGNGGSPAVAGDKLIICCDGRDVQYVVGLDKATGRIVWKTDRDTEPSRGFSFGTPTIIEAAGGRQAICPGSAAVFAYDPDNGKEIWRFDYGDGYSVVPRPMFAQGLVIVCSGFGDEAVYAIDPTGTGNVTESHVKWSTRKATPKSPSMIVVDDEVVMVSDDGVASGVDLVTGKQRWQQRLGGKFSASPIAAAGHLYFQSESGETTVLKAGAKPEEVARNQLGDGKIRTFASFAVLDDDLLIRSETHLYRISD